MSLRDRAKNVMSNFDATKDDINGYEGLPAGDYHMAVEAVQRTDYDQLSVKAQVIEGDNTGRIEFVNIGLDEVTSTGKPLPDFVIDRNIKTVARLAAVLGVAVTDDAWDDMGIMVHEFSEAVGKQFQMKLKLRENKKNPQYPYKEYEFEEIKQDPFETNDTPEVSDDDVPF
ncbi:hypothetical protein CPEBRM1_ABPJDJAI_00872 [Companilactobacillus paralimentarius]|uniref:hypothetical protein n=1 Tax=Companilactobacillus paralimentarius TaxID=83526 RepID=UPI003850CCBF